MGLWGNIADRVTGAICKNVLGQILNLPKLLDKPLSNVPVVNGLGSAGQNLGGGLLSISAPAKNKNTSPSVVPMWSNTFNNFGI